METHISWTDLMRFWLTRNSKGLLLWERVQWSRTWQPRDMSSNPDFATYPVTLANDSTPVCLSLLLQNGEEWLLPQSVTVKILIPPIHERAHSKLSLKPQKAVLILKGQTEFWITVTIQENNLMCFMSQQNCILWQYVLVKIYLNSLIIYVHSTFYLEGFRV